jgi:hypothetical protein
LLSVVLLLVGLRTARAQQAFESRWSPARAGGTEIAALPTFGIVPVGAAPLNTDVATELTEAVQRQLDATQSTQFEVLTRPSGGKIGWAFVVRNAARPTFDALTQQFTDQLLTCLHSLDDDLDLASLYVLLVGSPLDNQGERDEANAAGAAMLANWTHDRCATRKNNLPFLDADRPKLVVASRGMLTDVFDGTVFNGQNLLDLVAALYPIYLNDGGFLTTEMTPRIQALFDAAARTGLLTTAETATIADREQKTFWDWVILAVSIKPGLVRSFLETTATSCVASVAELGNSFQLTRCVAANKLALVTLHISAQDYTAAQRGLP